MNAEEAKVGCFQMVLVLLLGINYVIVAMSHGLSVFHNYTPKFYCEMKDSTHKSYGCQVMENSSMFANLTFTSPEVSAFTSCSGEYHFETEFMENSVVTEWGLVCEKRYLSFLGPTVYYIGVLLGAWITGFLIDRIGRLPVQAICLYVQGTIAVALYIVQSYPAFLVLRSLQGVFVQGLQNSTYILSLELFPARSRTLVALIMQISWSMGLILLALLSYVIPDWRILQLAVSVPTAITVLYIWQIFNTKKFILGKTLESNSINLKNKFSNVELYQETPSSVENFNKRHLPSNSKCDQESKMTTSSKCDKKISPKDTEEVMLSKIKKEKISKNEEKTGSNDTKQTANKINSRLKNAIESSILRKYGAIMICQWWTSTIACNILDDLTPSFQINRHITFTLSAILEMATNTFVYFVLSRYGRRLPICTYQSFNGIVCILIAVFFILTATVAPWIDIAKTTMLLFGKVTVMSTLSIVYLYTVEIFPTVIRGRCLGLCVMSAKIGSLSILHLLLLRHVSLPIPLLIIGILCLVSGVLVLILPETLNKILPDQVMDMKNIIDENNCKDDDINTENDVKEEDLTEKQILRQKLFSENWVDAGNGILVNFMENKNTE
ncbi:ORCT protein, partial [Acromyrmex heyeri]